MKGLLGKQVLVADTNTVVYQANEKIAYADININVLNPTANDATISVAISTSATTPAAVDFIEQNLILTGDGSALIRSGELMSPLEYLIVRSNVAGIVVRVTGKEQIS